MKLKISAQNVGADFDNATIEGCIAFSLENQGTSSCTLKIDDSEIKLPANTTREFGPILGFFYSGTISGKFFTEEGQVNEVLIIRIKSKE